MGNYTVGYGKPPQETRFPDGISGNPNGRPPKPIPDLTAMLDEPVQAMRNGKAVHLQPGEIALHSVFRKAVKDRNLAAIKHVISMLIKYEAWSPADLNGQGGGVVALPSYLPFDMGSMALKAIGPPDCWTEQNLKPIREAYLANRSEEQARIDDAIGYFE